MDRQASINLHQPQGKQVQTSNECVATNSRQVVKPSGGGGGYSGVGRYNNNNYNHNNNSSSNNNNNKHYYRGESNKQQQINSSKNGSFKQRQREAKFNNRTLKEAVDAGRHRHYLESTSGGGHGRNRGRAPAYHNNHHHHGGHMKNSILVSVKERFVQANCQFVMSPLSDLTANIVDPDHPVEWDAVEEILFSGNATELCCPICLDKPIAAKLTRCGHIYCWSCMLHYLALSDKESRSCPICFEKVKKSELKSVSIVNTIDFSPNDVLTFKLMRIRKNNANTNGSHTPSSSNVPLPVDYEQQQTNNQTFCATRIKRNQNTTLDLFAKLFLASSQYVTSVLEREDRELQNQLHEFSQEDMPEICFVNEALNELYQRKTKHEQLRSLQREHETKLEMIDLMASPSSPLPPSSTTASANTEEYTYFYQSEDGQPIYLHSINVRMLKHQYGELKNCPLTIDAKVIEMQRESVTIEARRRYIHLRHLPLACQYQIAEVELNSLVLSKETLGEFAIEINNRRKHRKRKEKEQRMRDRKIELENQRKIYGIDHSMANFVFEADFPDIDSLEDMPALQQNTTTTETSPIVTTESSSSAADDSNGGSGGSGTSSNGGGFQSSFAMMLSTGNNQQFNNIVRRSGGGGNNGEELNNRTELSGDYEEALSQAAMNITMSDFFDSCVKTSVNNNNKKKGKKKNRKKCDKSDDDL